MLAHLKMRVWFWSGRLSFWHIWPRPRAFWCCQNIAIILSIIAIKKCQNIVIIPSIIPSALSIWESQTVVVIPLTWKDDPSFLWRKMISDYHNLRVPGGVKMSQISLWLRRHLSWPCETYLFLTVQREILDHVYLPWLCIKPFWIKE